MPALGTINFTPPADGETADAADVATPLQTIYDEFNGNIDNANIKPGAAIALDKLAADAWSSWTPTLSGLFADAKWNKTGKYIQIGKTVHFRLRLVANTTTPMSGAGGAVFTLPVTAADYVNTSPIFQIGVGGILDSGTTAYSALVLFNSTTTGVVRNVPGSNMTSSTPMIWTTNDEICITGTYEAV